MTTEPAEPTDALRRALDDAEARLRAVVEVSGGPLGTLVFELRDDGELVFVHADEVAAQLITVARPPFYGKPLLEVFTGMVGTDWPERLRRTARRGTPTAPGVFVPPGTRTGRVFGLFAFQSEPGRVVLKFWESSGLTEVREIARRNQALLTQIFDNSPVAVALTRAADGTIVDVNARWSALTGYARHEALGHTTVELGFWGAAGGSVDALASPPREGVVQHPERRMHTRDGRWVVTAMHGSAIDLGGVPHVLVYLIDMTARAQAEEALRRLNTGLEARVAERTAELARARDDAERASRAKSDFLSGMSHELRTPMNAILGFGQLLQGDAELAALPRQRGYVREILRAGSHLLELINEVLDLARIEAGKLQLSLESVQLAAMIEDVVVLMRPVAAEHGVDLAASMPPAGCGHVRADRTRLRQVMLNLVSNAIKYNREGGFVRMGCEAEGDVVRLTVADSGPGLSAAQQARLFRDFERLGADQTDIQGTGIGLALSRRLVSMMQGEIGVDSEPGQGSTFWVRLQRAEPPPPPAAAGATGATAALPSAASDAQAARRVVLYVEDNPANALLMEGALRYRADIRMLHAPQPMLGLELARSERPQLVLLDIQLPGMDGYELLRRLRMMEVMRGVPVVAVSANAMPADLARGRAAGFDDYLTKPLDLAHVRAVVDRLLSA